jgi:hypothetical protein
MALPNLGSSGNSGDVALVTARAPDHFEVANSVRRITRREAADAADRSEARGDVISTEREGEF